MFGKQAVSAGPFVDRGLATFFNAVTEAYVVADINSVTAAFNNDITEPFTVNDTQTAAATFIGVITEDTQIADTSSAIAAFAAAIEYNFLFFQKQYQECVLLI